MRCCSMLAHYGVLIVLINVLEMLAKNWNRHGGSSQLWQNFQTLLVHLIPNCTRYSHDYQF